MDRSEPSESEASSNPLPLEGVRVLEMGQLIAGPFAGLQLAGFGAEVIKVEPPSGGDPMRTWRKLDAEAQQRAAARAQGSRIAELEDRAQQAEEQAERQATAHRAELRRSAISRIGVAVCECSEAKAGGRE